MPPNPGFRPTGEDLAQGSARVSVMNWIAGLDPVVPAKKKSPKKKSPKKKSPKKSPPKKPQRGWFFPSSKARNKDSGYDADASSEYDSDAPLLKGKKGAPKGILKNGHQPGPVHPHGTLPKKPAVACRKGPGDLDVIAEDTEDSMTLTESEMSSAPAAKTCQKKAAPVAEAGTSEATSEATTSVETTDAETTDAETTSASEQVAAAQSADEETQTAPVTTDDEATQSAPLTTDDEATQSAPATTDDEAEQPILAIEAAPAQMVFFPPPPPANTGTAQAQVPADPDWSPSLDAMLTAMKEGGERWKAITSALGKTRKDCSARWKMLQKNKAADRTNLAAPTTPAAFAGPSTPQQHLFTPSFSASNLASSPATKTTNGNGKGKAMAQPSSTSSSSSSSSVDERIERARLHEERMEQVLARLYAAHSGRHSAARVPAADGHFSELDCRVLGLLEARTEAEHWLALQAAFFNVTGRMVPVELLRAKMEGAE